MSAAEKAFWTMATIAGLIIGLVLTGCASHHVNVSLPPVRIQETTNNLPPVWPSDDLAAPPAPRSDVEMPATERRIAQAKHDAAIDTLANIAVRQALTGLIVSWTNEPPPRRWPGSSKRWPASWYFSGLATSTDLVTWAEFVRVPYQTNCSVPIAASGDVKFFKAFNGILPTPRIE